MAPEVKEYVSVNEKDFGKQETLKLTINGKILNNDLQKIVADKIANVNMKLDQAYNVSGMNLDKGVNKISETEIKALTIKLKEIIKGFNEEIARIDTEYIGKTKENQGQIQTEIASFFSDKSIFVTKGPGLVAALSSYSGMNTEGAAPQKTKETPLS